MQATGNRQHRQQATGNRQQATGSSAVLNSQMPLNWYQKLGGLGDKRAASDAASCGFKSPHAGFDFFREKLFKPLTRATPLRKRPTGKKQGQGRPKEGV